MAPRKLILFCSKFLKFLPSFFEIFWGFSNIFSECLEVLLNFPSGLHFCKISPKFSDNFERIFFIIFFKSFAKFAEIMIIFFFLVCRKGAPLGVYADSRQWKNRYLNPKIWENKFSKSASVQKRGLFSKFNAKYLDLFDALILKIKQHWGHFRTDVHVKRWWEK